MPKSISRISDHQGRKLSIILIFLGLGFPSFGQRDIWIGIKGGVNFANLNTSSASSVWDSKVGELVGFFGTFRKGKNAIQTEIFYSTHNHTRYFYPSQGAPFAYTDRFAYLNFPLFFKRYFGGSFSLEAGPQIGFLVKQYGLLTLDQYGNYTTGNSTSINRTNFSVCFGAGWDFPVGFLIDVRYNLGISDTNTISSSWTNRNRVIQLSIGWRMQLRKERKKDN